MYTYVFDIYKKELVADCKLYPTDILHTDYPWLYAKNNKYTDVNPVKVGKWMLFISKDRINAVWDKVKLAVSSGELWDTKVSTCKSTYSNHVIIIYTKDYTDLDDVIHVLNYLENSKIKPPRVTVYYKTDQQTNAGIYSGGEQKPWIYSSATIHETALAPAYTYRFDIHKKELVSDCKLYPTDILHGVYPWLYAKNNKYKDKDVNQAKVGKWMLFLSEDTVNAVWDKIKVGVANGELWDSKVSTSNSDSEYDTHAIMIYTKDYTDLDDVIRVHSYLESSKIKPPQVTLYYKTEQQTYARIYSGGDQRPWIYSSATIHEEAVATP